MRISMNWISDFVDLSGVDLKQLIGRFTLSTAEVEDIYEYGKDTENVVVGRILSIENHPNSKKLHLLKVDNGETIVDCVCGAPNVFEGALVAFAKCGGKVSGNPINEAQVAGYTSMGMCCSEKELGISEDHSGIMILNDMGYEVGTDIKGFMNLEDTIFEVDNKSLTNRPDLWGHYGIAREISVLVRRPLKPLEVLDTKQYSGLNKIDVKVETDLCYRYSCITVNNVTKKISPVNMKIRLNYCGQRPINLLADLTNYLMLELGQPMHAFDNDKVKCIRVKTFDEPVQFQTLDGTLRNIDSDIMMICNESEPTAVAGIMGGLLSEIEDTTDSLLLESANFDGVSVRKSATRLGMRTEASARYEKTLDPEITVPAIERFLMLLKNVDEGVEISSSLTDVYKKKYNTIKITFDKAYVDKYTGIDISEEEIEGTLSSLGFGICKEDREFTVTVPTFRATKDVTIKADIIEEITRIYGYDNFELKSTASLLSPIKQDASRENEYRIKQILSEHFGFNEVHSYIWYDNKQNKELQIEAESNVKIVNSLTGDNESIRSSIIPILLGFVNKNTDSYNDIGIFEIGRVVKGLNSDGLVNERKVLSMTISSRTKSENKLLSEIKEAVDYIFSEIKNKDAEYVKGEAGDYSWIHPKNSAAIKSDGKKVGYISVLNPRIASNIDKKLSAALVEIDYADFANIEEKPVKYVEVSKFPGMNFDLSLLTDRDMSFAAIQKTVMEYKCDQLQKCTFVDLFEGAGLPEGKVSMTIKLWFQTFDRTLQSEEVNGFIKDILELFKKDGIELR